MATNIDKRSEYTINGCVVDRASQRGVRGVRVEAWDRDTKYHDLLGQAVSDVNGRFTIGFDSVYFGDYGEDHSPDLYFKAFLDQREVLSTFERPIKNAPRGGIDIKLELDMPQLQPLGTDRVSVQQTLKAVDWWRASDFRGVWREGTDKVSTVGKLVGNTVGQALADFDFAPVRPKGTREREIVNQDAQNAERSLALQQVEVIEVRPISAHEGGAELRQLKDYPLQLKAGDQVILHTQDGVVKYYTRVRPTDASTVDGQTVARIDEEVKSLQGQVRGVEAIRADVEGLKSADTDVSQRLVKEAEQARAQNEEVKRLQNEVVDLRKSAASKDAEIVKLRIDLSAVRVAQENLSARLPLTRLEALEKQLKRLDPTFASAEIVTPARADGQTVAPAASPSAAKPRKTDKPAAAQSHDTTGAAVKAKTTTKAKNKRKDS